MPTDTDDPHRHGRSFVRPSGDRPARRRGMWMVSLAALLDIMAMGIVMPVLPGLIGSLTGSVHAAAIWTGVTGSLWAAMQFLCAPALGALADRFGRRPIILVSTAGLALDWLLMALAPNLWWLVVGRIVGGVTTATGTAIFAYMTDVTTPEERTRAFGMIGAAMSAGFVAGPAFGGVLGAWSQRLPFWAAAGLSITAFLYGLAVLPESLPIGRRRPFRWAAANPIGALWLLGADRDLGLLATGIFLIAFAARTITAVFVLYAAHRYGMDVLRSGVLLGMAGLLDLVMQGVVVGPVVRRLGDRSTVLLGLAGRSLGFLAMGLAPNGYLFALALLPNSMWGLAEPALRSLMAHRVPEAAQGRLQGASHCLLSLAGVAGPVFFGWAYAVSNARLPGLAFIIASAMVAVALLCAVATSAGPAAKP